MQQQQTHATFEKHISDKSEGREKRRFKMKITSGSAEYKGKQILVLQQSWEEENDQSLKKP